MLLPASCDERPQAFSYESIKTLLAQRVLFVDNMALDLVEAMQEWRAVGSLRRN